MKQITMFSVMSIILTVLLISGCSMQPIEEPEAQVTVVDYKLNPELRDLQQWADARLTLPEPANDAGAMPNFLIASSADSVMGDWMCEQEGETITIRLEQDGAISRVFAPEDVIDIGYFWFSGDEFHVVSDVDQANHLSVFHVVVETGTDGTFLRLEQCGGDCPNAAGVEWLNGLRRL